MKRRTIVKAAGLAGCRRERSPACRRGRRASSAPRSWSRRPRRKAALTYYTANFAETEQEVIKEFNKRFPKIKVAMVRAPGGQLITRIKTEAAAGKLGADVVNHSDRGLMLELADLFQDYTPPNAADYRPDALVSPKLWPGVTLGWAIAYNTQLVKNAPKTWMDLTKPEYKDKQIGQVVGPSGGTTWTRIMFERQVLGEDYWKKQAALGIALYPVGRADSPTRWCAAKSRSRRCSTTSSTPRSSKARRPRRSSRPRACRSSPTPTASPRPSKSPNAAKLFMNWRLSKEGQAFADRQARQHHLAQGAAVLPQGLGSQGDQGVGAEVRRVREAARALARASGTRPTAIASDLRASHRGSGQAVHDRARPPSTA